MQNLKTMNIIGHNPYPTCLQGYKRLFYEKLLIT